MATISVRYSTYEDRGIAWLSTQVSVLSADGDGEYDVRLKPSRIDRSKSRATGTYYYDNLADGVYVAKGYGIYRYYIVTDGEAREVTRDEVMA